MIAEINLSTCTGEHAALHLSPLGGWALTGGQMIGPEGAPTQVNTNLLRL